MGGGRGRENKKGLSILCLELKEIVYEWAFCFEGLGLKEERERERAGVSRARVQHVLVAGGGPVAAVACLKERVKK